ncbi:hypothetical protein D3C75_1091100 [compost metagenome]
MIAELRIHEWNLLAGPALLTVLVPEQTKRYAAFRHLFVDVRVIWLLAPGGLDWLGKEAPSKLSICELHS